jgi:hypothetical protein
MKYAIFSFSLLVILLGCSNETSPVNDKADKEDTKSHLEDLPIIQGNLLEYRPKVGTTRTFMNEEDEIYVQKVVAENEEYIQFTILLSGSPTTQIYRWTNTEIVLVYENSSPEEPSINIVDQFTTMGKIDTLINLETIVSDWDLIEVQGVVDVPIGTFKDVYILQKVTDEVENGDTIYTRFYAKGMGLIKETYELTGEHGYRDEANLAIIQ